MEVRRWAVAVVAGIVRYPKRFGVGSTGRKGEMVAESAAALVFLALGSSPEQIMMKKTEEIGYVTAIAHEHQRAVAKTREPLLRRESCLGGAVLAEPNPLDVQQKKKLTQVE